jgi:hypothetical protein
MFSGEALCLLFYAFQVYREKRRAARTIINEEDALITIGREPRKTADAASGKDGDDEKKSVRNTGSGLLSSGVARSY